MHLASAIKAARMGNPRHTKGGYIALLKASKLKLAKHTHSRTVSLAHGLT